MSNPLTKKKRKAFEEKKKHAQYMQAYYWKRDDAYRKKVSERSCARKKKQRDWCNSFKADKKCVFCKESEPVCLSFHHIDESKKLFSISCGPSMGKTIAEIAEEIEKCIIICENCHRKLHAGLITLEL